MVMRNEGLYGFGANAMFAHARAKHVICLEKEKMKDAKNAPTVC
jgi:hypothetical protein